MPTCWSRFFPARGETRPIVEINNTHLSIGRYNAIASIDHHLQYVGGSIANILQLIRSKRNALGVSVNSFVPKFTMIFIKRIKPMKEICSRHTVELNQITLQVFVNHSTLYSS